MLVDNFPLCMISYLPKLLSKFYSFRKFHWAVLFIVSCIFSNDMPFHLLKWFRMVCSLNSRHLVKASVWVDTRVLHSLSNQEMLRYVHHRLHKSHPLLSSIVDHMFAGNTILSFQMLSRMVYSHNNFHPTELFTLTYILVGCNFLNHQQCLYMVDSLHMCHLQEVSNVHPCMSARYNSLRLEMLLHMVYMIHK